MWNHTNLASGLLTDLYHVDSAYISWKSGRNGLATFDLYTRSAPFGGAWMLVAGTRNGRHVRLLIPLQRRRNPLAAIRPTLPASTSMTTSSERDSPAKSWPWPREKSPFPASRSPGSLHHFARHSCSKPACSTPSVSRPCSRPKPPGSSLPPNQTGQRVRLSPRPGTVDRDSVCLDRRLPLNIVSGRSKGVRHPGQRHDSARTGPGIPIRARGVPGRRRSPAGLHLAPRYLRRPPLDPARNRRRQGLRRPMGSSLVRCPPRQR